MRILVTNDDGVHAPGLVALVRALAAWTAEAGHELVVVAPLANHSGASAAVGTVDERESVGFRRIHIDGAESVPTFGVDATPALTVVIGAFGAFGPPPDLVVSGINLGVNVGRSVLHSGTVGAVLTGAQHGLRGLAVSMRSQPLPHHWDTATAVALAVAPAALDAPPRTVLNLNVPTLPLAELRGVVAGQIGDVGIVKDANARMLSPSAGIVELVRGTAIPSLGDTTGEDPADDAALIGAGFATLTALHGVGEDRRPESQRVVEQALEAASHRLSS